jgi:glycosyltransferase involved in cell wall biosynthesis
MAPRISVLLNAYVRISYIWEALASILSQDTRAELEVVILNANPTLSIPSALEKKAADRSVSIEVVPIPPGPVGVGLARGARAAHGEYLAILDDDDLWELSKLRQLETILDAHPGIAFIHNSQWFIDERNRVLFPLGAHRLFRHPSSLVPEGRSLVVDSTDPRSIARGQSFAPDFNNSSVTLRRTLLTDLGDTLELVRRGEDTFLYYCALSSRDPLYLTSDRLTRYRIHSGASTATSGGSDSVAERYRRFVEGHIESVQMIREHLIARGIPELKDWLNVDEAFWTTLRDVATGTPDRVAGKRRIRSLLGIGWARGRSRDLLAAGVGAAALLTPNLSRAAFGSWRRIW